LDPLNTRSGRLRLDKPFSSIKLNIPVKRNWLRSVFLLFLLLGWGFFEWFMFVIFTSPRAQATGGFSGLVLFSIWTLTGLLLLSVLSWTTTGKEQMLAGNGYLKMIQKSWFYYRRKSYDIAQITRIVSYADYFKPEQDGKEKKQIGIVTESEPTGGLAFQYEGKWVRIGKGLDAVDAQYILDKLKENGILSEGNWSS
jgi:hypothetical protein